MDRVITFEPAQLKAVADHAESAYPAECCGLLVGTAEGARAWRVRRVVPSPNLAPAGRRDRFEIDPALQLDLQRELRGSDEAIVGVYHSHPDGEPTPSATDLENAWEPGLVWLIAAVRAGRAAGTAAHLFVEADGGVRFEEVQVRAEKRSVRA
jgi:proteasome lid subunit RPN8/RPN11